MLLTTSPNLHGPLSCVVVLSGLVVVVLVDEIVVVVVAVVAVVVAVVVVDLSCDEVVVPVHDDALKKGGKQVCSEFNRYDTEGDIFQKNKKMYWSRLKTRGLELISGLMYIIEKIYV